MFWMRTLNAEFNYRQFDAFLVRTTNVGLIKFKFKFVEVKLMNFNDFYIFPRNYLDYISFLYELY